jgi:transcriptional regulator with PAS, ATPase and Fis domain
MKSMLPKQKSYIPRFALIFDIIDKAQSNRSFLSDIQPDSLNKAKAMSDYFINMSHKVKIDAIESEKIKTELSGSQTPKESFTRLYRANPEINKSKAAETLGVSRQTIINWIKEIKQ